ncbi:MAG: symmetrical bis(5'-nucleosyl)-tetraphosphatase [Proteobacteria bacterium]|nr:symmetrical bis(5'-nucleosyl)-tetraphosphatase [Pseudomonadota bacterium]
MATYAIGDVQGCNDELQALLSRLTFDRARDRLWFVGDLVNRGPDSLGALRFVRSLGDAAVVVLGNHDLHLLCVAGGHARMRDDDTLDELLAAPDAPELLDWLRGRPLLHSENCYVMVHAGLLPQWTIRTALTLACEVQDALRAPSYSEFLARMYGGTPLAWRDDLLGWDRLRVIVNAMTRLRFCNGAGEMDLSAKGAQAPDGFRPWFELRPAGDPPIICGHWSALGLKLTEKLVALDSGCVWGGSLTALRLEDRALFQVPCRGYQPPGE